MHNPPLSIVCLRTKIEAEIDRIMIFNMALMNFINRNEDEIQQRLFTGTDNDDTVMQFRSSYQNNLLSVVNWTNQTRINSILANYSPFVQFVIIYTLAV